MCRASPPKGCPARETTLTTLAELWHASGRSAAQLPKRLLALQGVLWSGPALMLASLLSGALTLDDREARFSRPAAWVIEPLRRAYLEDRDGALLLTLAAFGVALGLVWGLFGGALARMAAADLTGRGRESARGALAFARRHLRTLWGVPLFTALSLTLPLLLAYGLSRTARLPGLWGDVATPIAVLAVTGLALLFVVLATLSLACAFLARPAVACDDADLFDAVSRPNTYAFAGLPRLLGVRLWFLSGVLLGSAWRLARSVLTAAVALALIEAALGPARFERVLTLLGARGLPQDSARLGVTAGDAAAAAALGLAAAAMLAWWLADLASRLACARTAAYLVLRRAVDGVALDALATLPVERAPQSAAEAGFDEVDRVEAS